MTINGKSEVQQEQEHAVEVIIGMFHNNSTDDTKIESALRALIKVVETKCKAKDPIVELNREALKQRSDVGVVKYGTTLADNKGDLAYWLNHALEEGLDFVNYLQRAKAELENTDVDCSASEWKYKAQYWAAKAHELRGQALRGEPVDGIVPSPRNEVVERCAQAIYAQWVMQPGYVPWVTGGNSDKQIEARAQALNFLTAP